MMTRKKISNTGSGYSTSEHERVVYNAEVLELSTRIHLAGCVP